MWKIPQTKFKIREIIIITSDKQDKQQPSNEIEIEHEYVLVYQNEWLLSRTIAIQVVVAQYCDSYEWELRKLHLYLQDLC